MLENNGVENNNSLTPIQKLLIENSGYSEEGWLSYEILVVWVYYGNVIFYSFKKFKNI